MRWHYVTFWSDWTAPVIIWPIFHQVCRSSWKVEVFEGRDEYYWCGNPNFVLVDRILIKKLKCGSVKDYNLIFQILSPLQISIIPFFVGLFFLDDDSNVRWELIYLDCKLKMFRVANSFLFLFWISHMNTSADLDLNEKARHYTLVSWISNVCS